jgi:hypothetical protein
MNDQANGVRALFDSPDRMQDAAGHLTASGFDRADLSLASDASVKSAATDVDARQLRTLGASTAATAVALAAAGITVATGGAAAPAVAAAVLAGGAAGGATYAAQGAVNGAEQVDREQRAADGQLELLVRATTDAKRSSAEAILAAAGATHIETIG